MLDLVPIAGGLMLAGGAIALMPRREKRRGFLTKAGAIRHGYTGGEVPLGRIGRQQITAPKESFTLCIGPTGRGKTLSFIQNAILAAGNRSLVVFDYKGDLTEDTAYARSLVGPVYILDPGSDRTNHYNPYVDIPVGDLDMVTNVHQWIVPADGHSFYAPIAAELFAAAAAHVLHTSPVKTPPAVWDFLSRQGWHEELSTSPIANARAVAANIAGNTSREIAGSILSLLGWLKHSGVRRVMGTSEFRMADIQTQLCTVYIRLPAASRDTLIPYARMIIGMLTQSLMASETRSIHGATKRHGLTIVIDEVRELQLPNIDRLLSAGRSFGANIILANQMLAGIRDLYGLTVEGNCTTKLFFAPATPSEAKIMSQIMGSYEEKIVRQKWRGSNTFRTDVVDRPVMSESDILKIPKYRRIACNIDGNSLWLRTNYAPKMFAAVHGKPYAMHHYPTIDVDPWPIVDPASAQQPKAGAKAGAGKKRTTKFQPRVSAVKQIAI